MLRKKLENVAMKRVSARFGDNADLPSAVPSRFGVEIACQIRNSAMESRLGMMAVPAFTSSSASLPLTVKRIRELALAVD